MCIIVAKEKNSKLPSIETLRNCFTNNPDGAGFMYVKDNGVIIDKGYMTWKDFEKRYNKLCRRYNNFKNKALVMHFRIGTSGGNIPQNTHPYPIYEDTNSGDVHKTYARAKLGMVHNGVISSYTPKDKTSKHNDTQEFIMKYITPLYKHYKDFYKNDYIMEGLSDITGSRLAFLDTEENIYYVGDFNVYEECMFSNTTYRSWTYTYNTYYGGYNDYWDKYSFNQDYKSLYDKFDNDEYYITLEKNWFVAYNDTWKEVGDETLLYNLDTLELYREYDGELEFISDNCSVFDENYELIY